MTSNSTQFNRVRASDVSEAFRFAGEALTRDPSDTLLLNEVLAAAENEEIQDQAPVGLRNLAMAVQNLSVSPAIKNRFALAAVAASFPADADSAWTLLMAAFETEPAQLANLDWARRLAANSKIPDLRHTLEHFAQRAETGDFPADIYMELNDIVYTT
ncbi:MAG: hypothetical protein MUC87_13510 [Bacteroidia bacterium]|jgi:hypothetical protein|nr:hypothetical protein [Bacteroidia bacterium]